jgi:acetyl-CoA carboxylase biotin carboxyl carrier protein
MQTDDIRQLSAWLSATDIELLELHGPDHHVCLRREGAQVVVVAAEAHAPEQSAPPFAVVAPGVGLFLHQHPLGREPLVRAGERVRAGQVLALLKIGALLVPVNAPRDGVLQRTLVADGATVGFGTPVLEMSAL